MQATSSEIINLEHLGIVTQDAGRIGSTTVKVGVPAPCLQPNAPGQLRSFSDLDSYRSEARRIGSLFKKALGTEPARI